MRTVASGETFWHISVVLGLSPNEEFVADRGYTVRVQTSDVSKKESGLKVIVTFLSEL